MNDRPTTPLGRLDDASLETALRGLAEAIDWPTAQPQAAPDVATRVRVRLVNRPATRPRRRFGLFGSPLRRALVLALIALVALAAVAGAVRLGLPGLGIRLGEVPTPPPTVAPSATAPPGGPGANLGLGVRMTLAEARLETGRALPLPADPSLGAPDAVYVDAARASQVALVWAAAPDLPVTLEPGVGLILMSFDGTVEDGFFLKVVGGGSTFERLQVNGHPGFWIEGDPHVFFYEHGAGGFVDDQRRWVGDALLWSDGSTTYRIESALGRDATIAMAETIR